MVDDLLIFMDLMILESSKLVWLLGCVQVVDGSISRFWETLLEFTSNKNVHNPGRENYPF
jgi:hypothetical protein